jgi:predicted negative regulator of RcsB-dependent stress response
LAEQLKSQFGSTTYAQFAALHLAALAVSDGKLSDAEAQLRWVLGKAPNGSDTAQIAQLRLARVLAASGDTEQALAILEKATPGSYGASYLTAQGDILLAAGHNDEARDAYSKALAMAGGEGANLSVLQQKLQSLTPAPAVRPGVTEGMAAQAMDAASATNDTVDSPEG